MKRKVWLMLCVLTVLATVLVGCDGGGGGAQESPYKLAFIYILSLIHI
mgnify:CR=1 FL=1